MVAIGVRGSLKKSITHLLKKKKEFQFKEKKKTTPKGFEPSIF